MTSSLRHLAALVAAALAVGACGSDDREVEVQARGGASGSGGSGATGGGIAGGAGATGGTGASGGGGTGATGAVAGSDGGAGCSPACSGSTPVCVDGNCAECTPSSKKCLDDKTPQTCDGSATWKSDALCGGATPICNSGTCAGMRLRGGIGSLGPYPAATGAVRLKWGALELAPKICNGNVCVTGGITP